MRKRVVTEQVGYPIPQHARSDLKGGRAAQAYRPEAPIDQVLRRALDVAAASLGLLLLSPLFAAIAVAVKAHDSGPVFYRAIRVGRHGKPFRLYKFRSMGAGADKLGAGITHSGDKRITPVGRMLRRTKLDELPQLVNVLRGDMSLVGPRPEDPRYVALYTPEQRRVLMWRPGITSAASLLYRHEERVLSEPEWEATYREVVMPAKLAIDLEYLKGRTLGSDLRLIGQTVGAIFSRDGGAGGAGHASQSIWQNRS